MHTQINNSPSLLNNVPLFLWHFFVVSSFFHCFAHLSWVIFGVTCCVFLFFIFFMFYEREFWIGYSYTVHCFCFLQFFLFIFVFDRLLLQHMHMHNAHGISIVSSFFSTMHLNISLFSFVFIYFILLFSI